MRWLLIALFLVAPLPTLAFDTVDCDSGTLTCTCETPSTVEGPTPVDDGTESCDAHCEAYVGDGDIDWTLSCTITNGDGTTETSELQGSLAEEDLDTIANTSSCSEDTITCTCYNTPDGTIVGDSITAGNCESECDTENAGYADLRCMVDGVDTQLWTNETTPSPEEKPDPLIPSLIVDIPGLTFSTPTTLDGKLRVNFIGEYINAAYRWLIPAMTLVAVVMLMVAGLQYTLSRGNAEMIKKAKERMMNAVVGLILLLAAYNIAFILNPDTVRFSSLEIQSIAKIPVENFVEPEESVAAEPEGKYGVSAWQDCMLNKYGKSEQEVKSKLKTVSCKGKQVLVNEEIVEKFQAVCEAIENVNYSISDFGGQNWRANANNPKALSFHSWGVAFDINPSTNPNCGSQGICTYSANAPAQTSCPAGCTYDMPQEIIDAFKSQGFKWGGEYNTVKDYMHFSYITCGGS